MKLNNMNVARLPPSLNLNSETDLMQSIQACYSTIIEKSIPSASIRLLNDLQEYAEIGYEHLTTFKRTLVELSHEPFQTIDRANESLGTMETLTRCYGRQDIFNQLILLGSNLAARLIKRGVPHFQCVAFLAFHRHVMAVAMDTNNAERFGAITDSQAIRTSLDKQFPASAQLLKANLARYKDWHICKGESGLYNDHYNEVMKLNFVDDADSFHAYSPVYIARDGTRYPLSNILIPSEDYAKANKGHDDYQLRFLKMQGSKDLGAVLILHGGLGLKELREQLGDELEYLDNSVSDNSINIDVKSRNIAKILFLESHLTFIRRGGGSIPEMEGQGLLSEASIDASLYKIDDLNVWSHSMCFPDSEKYADFVVDKILKQCNSRLLIHLHQKKRVKL